MITMYTMQESHPHRELFHIQLACVLFFEPGTWDLHHLLRESARVASLGANPTLLPPPAHTALPPAPLRPAPGALPGCLARPPFSPPAPRLSGSGYGPALTWHPLQSRSPFMQ